MSWDIPPDAQIIKDREGALWYRVTPVSNAWTQFPGRLSIPAVLWTRLRGYGPFSVVERSR